MHLIAHIFFQTDNFIYIKCSLEENNLHYSYQLVEYQKVKGIVFITCLCLPVTSKGRCQRRLEFLPVSGM